MLNCFIPRAFIYPLPFNSISFVHPLGTWYFRTFSGFCCLDCLFHWLWSYTPHAQGCSSFCFDLPNMPPFILSWYKNLFTCLVADDSIFSYLCGFIPYIFLYNFSITLKKKETNFHDHVNNNRVGFFGFELDLFLLL